MDRKSNPFEPCKTGSNCFLAIHMTLTLTSHFNRKILFYYILDTCEVNFEIVIVDFCIISCSQNNGRTMDAFIQHCVTLMNHKLFPFLSLYNVPREHGLATACLLRIFINTNAPFVLTFLTLRC
jgi:hypothetical protein